MKGCSPTTHIYDLSTYLLYTYILYISYIQYTYILYMTYILCTLTKHMEK